MEVLKKCKLLLRIANLSNKNGFRLFAWKVPNFIVDLIFLLPMSICVMQMALFCFGIGLVLKEISSSIYLSLGIISIMAMYICLAAENDLIIATLDHLQEMVTMSEFVLTFFNYIFTFFVIFRHFFLASNSFSQK